MCRYAECRSHFSPLSTEQCMQNYDRATAVRQERARIDAVCAQLQVCLQTLAGGCLGCAVQTIRLRHVQAQKRGLDSSQEAQESDYVSKGISLQARLQEAIAEERWAPVLAAAARLPLLAACAGRHLQRQSTSCIVRILSVHGHAGSGLASLANEECPYHPVQVHRRSSAEGRAEGSAGGGQCGSRQGQAGQTAPGDVATAAPGPARHAQAARLQRPRLRVSQSCMHQGIAADTLAECSVLAPQSRVLSAHQTLAAAADLASCVTCRWDSRCMEDERWQAEEGVDRLPLQPFYHVLVDSRDRWDGTRAARSQGPLPDLAYVPQEALDAPQVRCPWHALSMVCQWQHSSCRLACP